MDLKTIYLKKTDFVVREIGNELILVPLVGNVAKMNEMFTMNETGKFIWESIPLENILNINNFNYFRNQ